MRFPLVKPSQLEVGDEVWIDSYGKKPVELMTISGFSDGSDSYEVGTPYGNVVYESVITGKEDSYRRYIQERDLIDGRIPLNLKH